jgi:hypothetical protein
LQLGAKRDVRLIQRSPFLKKPEFHGRKKVIWNTAILSYEIRQLT